jgi:hypothetical protein
MIGTTTDRCRLDGSECYYCLARTRRIELSKVGPKSNGAVWQKEGGRASEFYCAQTLAKAIRRTLQAGSDDGRDCEVRSVEGNWCRSRVCPCGKWKRARVTLASKTLEIKRFLGNIKRK